LLAPEIPDELDSTDLFKKQWPWDYYTQRNRRAFLLVLFLVGTSNYVDRNIIGVVLQPIKAEFHVSDTSLGLLSGISFALTYAILGIPIARWADRGDRKLVITLSLFVWNVTTALCGLASGFWQLAAARFGIGVGEAGAIPAAQSLLADYYAPTDRARAFGVFLMSSSAGFAIALVLGGFITQNYGWRYAFLGVSVLGIGLAPLTYLVLKEPRRAMEFAAQSEDRESTIKAIRALFAKPTYRNILASIVVYFLMAHGALVFLVSFLIRVHELNVARAGATYGTISAVGAIVGNLAGGAVADQLARKDLAWLARLAGWGMIAAMPIYQIALWSSSLAAMVPLLLLATVLLTGLVPSMYSALHLVCGSKRRAMAIAIAFFFANLIGLGLGPVIAGALSDALGVHYGAAEGLRYALILVMTALVPAGWFMLRAARYLKSDVED
jgi:predicted MFS family arabinose efflux permease